MDSSGTPFVSGRRNQTKATLNSIREAKKK
jgi:hypothetical protein